MKRAVGGGGGDGLTHGEIIQVQGGHILRATGRKDRHSKVYTSKGPRDRRVRLSAHTAIQFYDVQDRLGYDRPSKAVDWLIKKAKNSIDKLAELPHPSQNDQITMAAAPSNNSDSNPGSAEPSGNTVYAIQSSDHLNSKYSNGNSAMNMPAPPPGAETQSIADTMKSFFPVCPGNSLMNMQTFPDERMTRPPLLQSEDLGLSLHTLQDQDMNHRSYTEQMLFSGSNPTMFESNYHQKSHESWSGGAGEGENRNIGFIFNPHSLSQQLYFSQNSAFSQREPLQSNYSNLLQAWNERVQMPSVDHHHNTPHQAFNQSSFYNFHFGSDFQVPARIRGEEDPGVVSGLQTSSVSPSSQH